ncbi:hyaluronan mediated motility receptor-like isoform X2 [Sinocyclocheilus anshuiensis]|uniref:hyaluronan mediated motility receptor-like isoform X2 n=1 Tax=Sinocyclocheilus anshuiensis TaxID=1608454 RepID=UPI0007B9F561|nr:PREDICTED: hyaluronan mediated motility receptor-like isoform X2 [Sinocyclocheilus anshuiensis]
MSFSRAPLKRFNEHAGCAPPPGTYEVKSGDVKGTASFHKAERFRSAPKTVPLPSPSKEVPMSPVRRTMSVDGLADALSSKQDKNGFTLQRKHQRLLEKEIRSLVQQRGEQDRRLLTLEEELKKLESKLLVAVREKTGLAASVASLERQLAELKKANEFLKTKVSADITKKKINALSMELIEAKNKLDAKDKELSFLQISTEGKVKVLETDLETARATFRVLQERNKDLEALHQETRVQNEQLENEMDKLHNIIQELREEIKALQSYLDSANDEIQDLRIKLQDKSTVERRFSDAQENLSDVEKKLEKCTSELQDCQELLKVKEEELQDSQKALEENEREVEQHVQDLQASQTSLKELEEQMQQGAQDLEESRSTVQQQEQELARVKEILRRTEEELDQRVALMGERCLVLEDERARTQEEGLRRVQELKAEISSLEESRKTEKEAYKKLEEEHDALTKQLEEKKTHSDSLASMLERLRDETEVERRQLGEELEDALEELSELEKQEQCSEEAIQHLTQNNHTLEQDLKNTCSELEKKCTEMQALEEAHVVTIKKLEEDHNSCLAKLGDVTTDYESTRRSLGEQKEQAEAQAHQLQEEMNQLKQQLQQDQQKLISYQEMQDKQREEHAGMLLKVQTKLAQREEELKQAAETLSEELRSLQAEVKQERGERERAQAQLEREQKRQSVEGRSAEASRLRGRVEELEDKVSELNRQVQEERDAAEHQAVEWQQERRQLCRQMEEERQDHHKQLSEAQLQSTCDAETEHWRNLYEELYAKVKPFQEQLDRFAAERNALLNEKGATQAELNKLADAYANLMGHQNQKQKIKHMVKLKEENLELKEEVFKLRAQVGKQKQELDRLKSGQTPRRLDPSEAFKYDLKENQQPTSALSQGNKKLY